MYIIRNFSIKFIYHKNLLKTMVITVKNKKKLIGSIIILTIFVGLLCIGYVFYQNKTANDFKVEDSFVKKGSKNESTKQVTSKKEIKAQIYGEVNKPGVYSLNSEDRIEELINDAGGFTDKADKYSVNGAAKVNDGANIYVKAKGEKGSNVVSSNSGDVNSKAAASEGSEAKLDINSATEEDIVNKKIKGIGAGLAKKIIDYREKNGGRINSVEDLQKAIGAKRGKNLSQYVEIN